MEQLTLFHQKRFNKGANVFVYALEDDPRKTPEWVEKTKRKTLPHIYAAEYERDYGAGSDGSIIKNEWVRAAQELYDTVIGQEINAETTVGYDVGAGSDKSVVIAKHGHLVSKIKSWADGDTINGASNAIAFAEGVNASNVYYDSVGVGHGVTSVTSRYKGNIKIQGVNAGDKPSKRAWPDKRTSEEMFDNLKAEMWWMAREMFKRTYDHVNGIEEYPLEELIALPREGGGHELAAQLSIPKWQTSIKGKIQVESKKQLSSRGIKSPDHADAFILTMFDLCKAKEKKKGVMISVIPKR